MCNPHQQSLKGYFHLSLIFTSNIQGTSMHEKVERDKENAKAEQV